MDTSKTYIQMCEKAEEIQKGWKVSWGDWAWYKLGGKNEINFPHLELIDNNQLFSSVVIEVIRRESIWLPRQDQLQEMIDNEEKTDRFWRFVEFLRNPYDKRSYQITWVVWANEFSTSMEQLWLAFVMKEKYNKVWNEENWIKEE